MAVEFTLDVSERGQLLALWFADYKAPLFRYLVRLVGDQERAADLLQETFLRAHAALARGPTPANPSSWLYRIATNLAYDALRRRRRLRWIPLQQEYQAPSFEGDVATAELVRRCLARLRPKEAEALLLHEYSGLTYAEIAALAGEEPAAVRVRVYRACKRFCEFYEEEAT